MEAYGLIGVFISISAIISLFDFGLGTTLNRELARMSAEVEVPVARMNDLVRTLEVVYCATGVLLGIAVALLAPFLAAHWIKARQLPPQTIEHALMLMGLAIACQWPGALYAAGLFGLRRQSVQNAIAAIMVGARTAGTLLVLWKVSPTIEAFLVCQVVASAIETALNGLVLWRTVPATAHRARFRVDLLREIWRFAAGVTGISVMSVIVMQLDKVILSGLLSLEAFGHYMVANRLASGLFYLVAPVVATFFPRFSYLHAAGTEESLRRVYHQACQAISFLVLPPALMLVFFPYEILQLWMRDASIAEGAYLVLSLLAAGTALNALATPPHLLQLASGWTRLSLVYCAVTTAVLGPLVYLLTVRFGAVGAAVAWVLGNIANLFVNAVFTHRRLLRSELRSWYATDVAPALAVGLLIAIAGRWVIARADTTLSATLALGGIGLVALAAIGGAMPEIRRYAIRQLTSRFVPAR